MYICTFLFTVPSPVIEVASIDIIEFGRATTLECRVIAVRGITSRVDIIWRNESNFTIVKRVENVTANIVNNSAVYIDQLVTPPLSTNDIGRIYYCEVSINGDRYNDSIVLDFIGEYTMHHYVMYVFIDYLYEKFMFVLLVHMYV